MSSFTEIRHILTLIVLFMASTVGAQTILVSGTVVDSTDEEPVIGATVTEKGTSNVTATNIDGEFSIKVAPEATLVFNSIGMAPKEVAVKGQTKLNVRLDIAYTMLDEVVAIGYGTQRKSDITGSISSVSAKQLNDVPVASALQAMQGKAAGVNIIQNTGAPGGNTTVKIRGTGTINDAEPLYVVDGFIVDNINHINPDDIENVEIFKDAASSAIFGARAANGVIAITTKSGVEGKVKITFDTYVGISNPWKKIDVMGVEDYALMRDYVEGRSQYSYKGQLYMTPGVDNVPVYDDHKYFLVDTIRRSSPERWVDAVTRTGVRQAYNISMSGGNEKTRFLVSAGYFNEKGIVKRSDYQRFNARMNINHKITNWLTFNGNMSYVSEKRNVVPEGNNSIIKRALYQNPLTYIYDTRGYWSGDHPIAVLERYHERVSRDRFDLNVDLTAKFLKYLTYQFKASWYMTPETVDNFAEVGKLNSDFNMGDLSEVYKRDNKSHKWEVNNLLTFDWALKDIHHVTVLAGQTAEGYKYNYHESIGKGTPSNDPDQWFLSSSYTGYRNYGTVTDWHALGLIGRINYSLFNRYLFQVNFRADGSSKFSKKNRWGYFPSVSLGWRLNKEAFLRDISWINETKLRVGWGKLGNNRIYELARYTYLNSQYNYPYGNGNHILQPGATAVRLGNDDIKWEKTENFNAGLDLAFFNNRLTATVEYFNKKTTDMLLEVPTVISAGLDVAPMTNAGSVRNYGFEFSVNHRNTVGDWRYEIGVNLTYLKNKVLSLGTGNEPIYGAYLSEGSINDYVTKTAVGKPIGSFFGYVTDGIFNTYEEVAASAQYEPGKNLQDQTTRPGDFRFKDLNGDGKITAEDRTFLGSPLPDFVFGIPVSVGWKNWSLDLMFQGQTGNKIFNVADYYLYNAAEGNVYADIRSKHWSGQLVEGREFFPINHNASVPDLDGGDAPRNFRASDFLVKDGDYLRLKELRLTYMLPAQALSRLHMDNLAITFSAYNLWTITGYDGMDPEVGKVAGTEGNNLNMGVDHGNYPQARSFLFGLKFTL